MFLAHGATVQGADDPICQGGNARFRVAAGRGLDSGLRRQSEPRPLYSPVEVAAARSTLASLLIGPLVST